MKIMPIASFELRGILEFMFMDEIDSNVLKMKYETNWDHVDDEASEKAWADAIKSGDIEIRNKATDKNGYTLYFLMKMELRGKQTKVPILKSYSKETSYLRVTFCYEEDVDQQVIMDKLMDIWPENKPNFENHKVLVNFWVNTPNGPKNISRYIEVNEFEKIKGNYSKKTRDVLHKIVEHIPTRTGQIILLSGDPGTGKTHALRSIMWEWRNIAEFNYIIDPMAFFGGDPMYLTQVLFNSSSDTPVTVKTIGQHHEAKWRVFILEDSEELLTIDAKEKVGQALSQLCNVTDGMIGQGLKLLFFMTTNAKIEKFHPAISRPGRCMVKHEFTKLAVEESEEWMKAHGVEIPKDSCMTYTVAELYELLEKDVIHTDGAKKKEIGFAAANA